MMSCMLDKIKYHGLFLKMFLVMMLCIVSVGATISYVTLQMSTNLFTNTFGITNSKVINQVKGNFEAFNYSIVTAVNRIQQSGVVRTFLSEGGSDSRALSKAYYNMNQQMTQINSVLSAYEVGIMVTGVNGRKFSNGNIPASIYYNELKNSYITENTKADPKRLMYQFLDAEGYTGYKGEPLIIASKALVEHRTGEVFGAFYVTMSERNFKQLYSSITSEGNDIVILENSQRIVSSNREDWVGKIDHDLFDLAQTIEKGTSNSISVKVLDQESIVLAEQLPSFNYHLVNVIDRSMAIGQMFDTKTIILVTGGLVLVALIIVFLLSRQLTKPLTVLVKQMSDIRNNHFDSYVPVKGSYEVRKLGEAYNFMLDEIHEYVEQLVQTQKEQRNAELTALQRQINPHFLYNTLTSIKILVQQGSRDKAAETINALIVLLQNAIGNIHETNTIEEEMVILKNYVFINQVRYGERIRVYYFVAPDCMGCHVPKLIIQPFIENAFFHAFNRKEEGTIHVLIHQDENTLVCEVNDNGDGYEDLSHQEDLPRSQGKRQLFSGIGVKNVNSRIKLLYGDGYGVTIVSVLGGGTKVKIRIPVIRS